MAAHEDIIGLVLEEEQGDFDPFEDSEAQDGDDGITDLPVMSEMPEHMHRRGMYDADRYEKPEDAIEALLRNNPGRKPVLLKIIEGCTDALPMGEVEKIVSQAQASNASVYSATTLCAMLERCGALTRSEPEREEKVVVEEGVEYREVGEEQEPLWTATDAGLTVVATHREGGALRELLAREAEYESIYMRLLAFCAEEPRTKPQIDKIIDDDPLVQRPRRYSNHFIELLENREAMEWVDGKWTLTELGREFLAQINETKEN